MFPCPGPAARAWWSVQGGGGWFCPTLGRTSQEMQIVDVSRQSGSAPRAEGVTGDIGRFAMEVLSRIAARSKGHDPDVRAGLVLRVTQAVLAREPADFDALRAEMRRGLLDCVLLADSVIPEVARALGDDWVADRLPFVSVSVGCARLQSLLRTISEDWHADGAAPGQTGAVLVVVPEGEQHTMGAFVLAAQLRRRGISVALGLGCSGAELCRRLRAGRFDGVLVTVGAKEKLETASNLVKMLKEGAGRPVPVAVGGAVFADPSQAVRMRGADLVTDDVELALRLFGLGQVASMRPVHAG